MIRAVLVVLALLVALEGGASAKPRWQTLPMPPAMPEAVSSGHVTVGDARIYWATYGKGDPVILLHGGAGNADHWAFQVPELAAKYRVIAIDSRHHGRSTLGKARLSYATMAGDVLAVMDALRVERAAIVGWSDGGEIALALAIHHPRRVAKAFVFAASYEPSGATSRAPSATVSAYFAKCRSDYQKIAKDPAAYDKVLASLRPMWRSSQGYTKQQLRAIEVPITIAAAVHDELIDVDPLKAMAKLVPNAKLVVFDDASHFAPWQDPTAFTRAVLAFLAS